MYICMCACACIYTRVCATRVLVSSLSGNVRQRVRPGVCHKCFSNVRHQRFSSVRHCVRRVIGGCLRFWKEKDDGEKEEKQEEKKQEGK